MGLKLRNPRQKDIFFDTEKLGRLYIFSLVLADFEKFYKEVKSVATLTPAQYIRALVKQVCHQENKLIDRQYRPEQPTLNENDVNLISESEFEDFAEKYITQSDLNREWVSKAGKSEEGVNSVTLELGEIEYPRNEGEKWVDYLHRLAVIKEKKLSESFKKIARQFEGIEKFSKNLQEQMKNTFSLSDSLKKSIESFNISPDIISRTYKPPFDFREIPPIKPFAGLPEKMDNLIETSATSAALLTAMNTTQTGIAGELKSSGDKTARYSMTNLFFGGIIILLTIISLYLAYNGTRFPDSRNQTLNKNIETVGNELKSLNENAKVMLENNRATLEQMIEKDADSKGTNQKLLLKLFEQQNLIISELKNIREQDKNRIDLLERQLKEVSQKIKEQEGKGK